MTSQTIILTEMTERDVPFLLDLWNRHEVMRYADEFPGLRGWKKSDTPETAWEIYQQKRAELGPCYTQLILYLADSLPIGESFICPLPEGYRFGKKWEKPTGILCVMGDIKLLPDYWGQGLGTAGMKQVVQWVFSHTPTEMFAVPPNRRNPAAKRVYEKAGFQETDSGFWYRHEVMALSKSSIIKYLKRQENYE